MKIEDMQTLPEFFGVETGEVIWVEGYRYRIHEGWLYSRDRSSIDDGRVLVGCLTGQLEWSTVEPSEDEFGSCDGCGYEFNSELINEYEIAYCPKCGRKIGEATEEIIVPAMTAEEENILREIAAWFPQSKRLFTTYGDIYLGRGVSLSMPFGDRQRGKKSKAYEILVPILEKYGEINLEEYREAGI